MLQISLDGPKEINDKSRNCPGITEIVLKNLEDIAKYCAETCTRKSFCFFIK